MNANRRPILRWLTTQLASYLEVPATAINPMVPLAEMGVDSVHAISLVGDVELHFDIDVDPTMIFDYPTLAGIAEFISTAVAEQQTGGVERCPSGPVVDNGTRFADPALLNAAVLHLARNSGLSNRCIADDHHQCIWFAEIGGCGSGAVSPDRDQHGGVTHHG